MNEHELGPSSPRMTTKIPLAGVKNMPCIYLVLNLWAFVFDILDIFNWLHFPETVPLAQEGPASSAITNPPVTSAEERWTARGARGRPNSPGHLADGTMPVWLVG